jgi:hypothetical protein
LTPSCLILRPKLVRAGVLHLCALCWLQLLLLLLPPLVVLPASLLLLLLVSLLLLLLVSLLLLLLLVSLLLVRLPARFPCARSSLEEGLLLMKHGVETAHPPLFRDCFCAPHSLPVLAEFRPQLNRERLKTTVT